MADARYKALLIGNSTFPNDSQGLPDLEGPVNDVAVLRDALTNEDAGLFEGEKVRLVSERTSSEILMELERFFGSARRDDTLLLYYSGHGILNERNQLLLCARDTRTDLLKSTSISSSAINAMFDDSAAQTTIIVLDCCHSGAFKSGGSLANDLRGTGRYLLTSSRGGELANDANRENGTSVFTGHLVEALVDSANDSDGDGYIGLTDAYDYVYERMTAEGKQIPQRSFSGGGEISIARRLHEGTSDPGPIRPVVPQPQAAPILELSTDAIDFGDLTTGERPSGEPVFVVNRGGGRLDWIATSTDPWLTVGSHDAYFSVTADPRPGANRGKVVVFDRASGTSKTVQVSARVAESPTAVMTPEPVTPAPTPAPARPRRGLPPLARTAIGVAGALLLVVVAVSVIASGGGGGGDGGDSGSDRVSGSEFSDEVTIGSDAGWINTGLEVVSGDKVFITATGQVRHAVNDMPTAVVGPDGDPKALDHGANVVMGFGHGGLVGRIGESGTPFAVGSQASFVADSQGQIHLRVNDYGIENNDGQFIARIRVVA